MRRLSCHALLLSALAGVCPGVARADEERAAFALVIGVNDGVDGVPPLRYADDDAALYLELFRSLHARAYLLATIDENTARLHPQAAAEAQAPRERELARTVTQLRADVAQAHARGLHTELYIVYAGHGNVAGGEGYVELEDGRLTGGRIAREIVDRIGAGRTHVIVDACYSSFLAIERGPGGERRHVEGFSGLSGLGSVGLLLSTSTGRESHEWEGFQAGVFSHEVRSGLYGAADADGDGVVTYREMAAFVTRANAAIPNERFRPDVFARPPAGSDRLADLRPALDRHIDVGGAEHAHYVIEDANGVRLAEFHNGPGQAVRLVRPAPGRLYIRRDDVESLIPAGVESVALADTPFAAPRTTARGAAHEAFSLIFTLPFDATIVDGFVLRAPPADLPSRPRSRARTAAWIAFGAAAAVGIAGAGFTLGAQSIRGGIAPDASQKDVADANARIALRNDVATVLYSTAAAAAVTGVVIWLWPDSPLRGVNVAPIEHGGAMATFSVKL